MVILIGIIIFIVSNKKSVTNNEIELNGFIRAPDKYVNCTQFMSQDNGLNTNTYICLESEKELAREYGDNSFIKIRGHYGDNIKTFVVLSSENYSYDDFTKNNS